MLNIVYHHSNNEKYYFKLSVKSKFSDKLLTKVILMCNLSDNKFEIATHSNKESRTYTADTESLHLLKEDTERKFENGL